MPVLSKTRAVLPAPVLVREGDGRRLPVKQELRGSAQRAAVVAVGQCAAAGPPPGVSTRETADEMDHSELLKRITARPDVFDGKPIIRNMRLSVELILSLMAQGLTTEAILDEYPELERDDVRACVAYAHAVIARDTLSAVSVAEP